MTEEPVRDEKWHAKRNKAFSEINTIFANLKTRRTGKRTILQQNIEEIQALNQEFKEKSVAPIAKSKKTIIVETENPGW